MTIVIRAIIIMALITKGKLGLFLPKNNRKIFYAILISKSSVKHVFEQVTQ